MRVNERSGRILAGNRRETRQIQAERSVMKFGIFYEHQLPRPWEEGAELQLFQDALAQVELADRLGIDYAWEVEHHFLEEYSHSSAPEVFLAAASQRSRRIRLGHGIVLMPPGYNHPARVAERVATLDLVSGGRVDWGTGESASRAELEGFGINPADRRAMWRETVEQVANMMVMDPYPGFAGQFFSMPARNVVPKPVQKPHPPIWVACSNRETIHLAAQLGIGALTFAFIDPAEARHWVADYYDTFKRECVPIGHAVNPNIAMVTGFSCHADAAEAARRGNDGFRFFQFALAHHYVFGKHTPGRTNIWNRYLAVRDQIGTEVLGAGTGCIGTPAQLRESLRIFQDAGVDQTIFIQQGGKNRHEHICEALELFAAEVMPEFHEQEAEREARKLADLAPAIEAAFARKRNLPALADAEIPTYQAYGNTVALTDADIAKLPDGNRRRVLAFRRIAEVAERA
jgi:alkanesulfonate monooxygenase SsuD/methylene tetrahydromethanopterin reductase-like flavin-dependent oxidoreductase (luciferase family)